MGLTAILVAAALPATPVPQVDPDLEARVREIAGPGAWAVDPKGWDWLVGTDTLIVYTRSAKQAGQYKRVWVRYEFRTQQESAYGAYQSTSNLTEVDCSQRRNRAIQIVRYRGAEMTGDVVYSDAPDAPKWSFSLPGTVGDQVTELACR